MVNISDIEQFKFENDISLTRDSNGNVTQITITGKTFTKTITLTRDSNGNVTEIKTTIS